MHPRPLPPALPAIFSTTEARSLGVTPGRLRSPDLVMPFHGVRWSLDDLPRDPTPAQIFDLRVQAYATRMSDDEFFSHETAAALWNLPVRLSAFDREPLHVSVRHPLRAPRTRGVRGHQVREHLVTVVDLHGAKVTDPVSTWAMLARRYGVIDLVCLGDALIRDLPDPGRPHDHSRPGPIATRFDLLRAIEAGPRPGRPQLERATELMSERSRSPAESRTRLLLAEAGLPTPELNMDVRDGSGRFVANVDFAFPRFLVAVEYEGDHHRIDLDQFRRDIERIERMSSLGWRIVRLVSAHVYSNPDEAARRVRGALHERGWRG